MTAHAPLAHRMRPTSLEEVVGHGHVTDPAQASALRGVITGQGGASLILHGPPGTGKTTLAGVIAETDTQAVVRVSAPETGVGALRTHITEAAARAGQGVRTVLVVDEVHRFSKNQQDTLLDAVEAGTVVLVGITTENPAFVIVDALLSRTLTVRLEPLGDAAVAELITRAVTDTGRGVPVGTGRTVELTEQALAGLVARSGGDGRRALTYTEAVCEAAVAASTDPQSVPVADLDLVVAVVGAARSRGDRDGDQHYDVISAFIKSIRGSDADAALHWLARMLESGEDPRFIARRLMIHATEDIGLADPGALTAAVNAAQVVERVGMPEGRLALAQASVHLALAPKSNAVYVGINEAVEDVREGRTGTVPTHLRDGHYARARSMGNAIGYRYPHDDPRGVLAQDYFPAATHRRTYYRPVDRGDETRLGRILTRMRQLVTGQ